MKNRNILAYIMQALVRKPVRAIGLVVVLSQLGSCNTRRRGFEEFGHGRANTGLGNQNLGAHYTARVPKIAREKGRPQIETQTTYTLELQEPVTGDDPVAKFQVLKELRTLDRPSQLIETEAFQNEPVEITVAETGKSETLYTDEKGTVEIDLLAPVEETEGRSDVTFDIRLAVESVKRVVLIRKQALRLIRFSRIAVTLVTPSPEVEAKRRRKNSMRASKVRAAGKTLKMMKKGRKVARFTKLNPAGLIIGILVVDPFIDRVIASVEKSLVEESAEEIEERPRLPAYSKNPTLTLQGDFILKPTGEGLVEKEDTKFKLVPSPL